MSAQRSGTTARRMAQVVVALNLIMAVTGIILNLDVSAVELGEADFWSGIFWLVEGIVYSVIALIIISRHPRHTVGWLFLGVGFFAALGTLGSSIEAWVFSAGSGPRSLAEWVAGLFFIPVFLVPLTLVLQFFPDGRLPSRRWWPIPLATSIGFLGLAAGEAQRLNIDNLLGGVGSDAFLSSVVDVTLNLLTIGFLGTLLIVIVRFRRAQGRQRAQMKWLVYAAVIGLSALFLTYFLGGENSLFQELLFIAMPTILALAMGIAILRHHLFDIDIIIRRTVQYAVVSGLLVAVYFGLVVMLTTLLAALGARGSELVTVLATLTVAALFAPLRRRVQALIDRRFFRQKYDAQQVLAQFAQTARDEMEWDALRGELVNVVQETMQPERVSLWLRDSTNLGRGRT